MRDTNVIRMPGVQPIPEKTPKTLRSTMDTVLVTPAGIDQWKRVPFQRPLRVNSKVRELSETIKKTEVIPGVLVIGVMQREKYLLDGQHRIAAFLMAAIPEGYADIRMCHFDSMAEMGDEFVNLNSPLVKLRPDDILRGLEQSIPAIQRLRRECPFIGYDSIRRGPTAPLLSMSLAIRAWLGGIPEVPGGQTESVRSLVERLDDEETGRMSMFLKACYGAWGHDVEYYKMWGTLNITIAAWLWRRCVVTAGGPRVTRLTPQQFQNGLMALTTGVGYMDWLTGRVLGDRDRSPCYSRMKALIVSRVARELGKAVILPSPPWAHHQSGHKPRVSLE